MLDAIENEGVEIQVTPAADGSRRATATTTQVRARDLAKRVPSKEDAEKIVAELRSSHMSDDVRLRGRCAGVSGGVCGGVCEEAESAREVACCSSLVCGVG
eukprot:2431502-Rhodomonas_salina.1